MSDRKRALEAVRPDSALSAKAIEQLITEVPVSEVMQVVKDLLTATCPGEKAYPDWRARENGVKLWMSYVVGLPTQRIEETQTRVNVTLDPEKMLSNPATLEAIARKLRGTEAGTRLLDALASQPRQVEGSVVDSPSQ